MTHWESGVPPQEPPPAAETTQRQRFVARFEALSAKERESLAREARDPDLAALCFDPLPAVIRGVLENPVVGLVHARLIAAHHRHAVALEHLAAHAALLRDGEVQRLLLRNVQTPDTVARRLLSSRRLPELHGLCQSHDLPERHRATARTVLRSRFATAQPEERIELILATEGRALGALSGTALDGRSVALLCARSFGSPLLVENLAHWAASPPALIAHLLRQPLVLRTPALKLLLRRHPNCPRSGP